MRPTTLLRLAASGTRTDSVRMVLTVFGSAAAALAWLCAATVASIGVLGRPDHYSPELLREAGLRPGVVATFVLLTIPVLALLAQSARLGAPHRDRRIAAMRLAGATPRQVIALGAGESGVAALVGVLAGLGVFIVLRDSLDRPESYGQLPLPTDILPPIAAIVAICLLLPLIVTAASAWLLRRVVTTPLGVVHRVRRRHAPRPWPGVLIVVGVATFAVFEPVGHFLVRHHVGIPPGRAAATTVFFLAVLMTAVGASLGAGWISYTAGRVLRRFGRGPATTLASARLLADPWQGSRTFGVLIVATVFAGGTAAVYGTFVVQQQLNTASQDALNALAHQDGDFGQPDTFYTDATLLVFLAVGIAGVMAALGQLVSISEAIVSRRRSAAALVATGVPRSVLARTQVWQAMAVAVPSLVLAVVAGMLIPRFLFGTTVSAGAGSMTVDGGPVVEVPDMARSVPVPWAYLGIVVGVGLLAVLVTVGIGLLFLRSSTRVEELRTG